MKEPAVSRREFLGWGATAAAAFASSARPVLGANDRINLAVIGIRSRGKEHYREWLKLPNVQVRTICDPDENLLPAAAAEVEKLQGKKPKVEFDLRKVYEDRDIDAVSIAAPDHWHSLAGIWACQAGKHVYVEKPVSHNIWEGRKLVEAARRYNRIVAAGMQNRSIDGVRAAMQFLHEGKLGEVYMAKGLCFKPRDSIGHKPDCPVPEGVHYDLWLGPAPYRPFNPNRFHYNWHWFWDYGCSDMGNQGPHQMDIARWGLDKRVYPKKIHCAGGYYAFDSDQESPNTQIATFEYEDGKILQFEVRGLYTNGEDGITIGNLFYGSLGWMRIDGVEWKTFFGRKNEPGPYFSADQSKAADPSNLAGAGSEGHFTNFISTLRSGNGMNLNADIEEGHLSTSLCHLGNIANRLGRQLTFDSHAERFEGDDIADAYLTRDYRHPYAVPERV